MASRNLVLLIGALAIIAIAIIYLESLKPAQPVAQQDANSKYPKAPELAGITGYINAPSNLTIASLQGRVVLIDFWTYSCINCIRTLPYLNSWHEKYSRDGLVIIGVHTPEFEFEKDYATVQAAVEKFGIKYAVVLDNNRGTWNAYRNYYWPRKYLIDADGRIRYDHIGEGGYDETEERIVALLSEGKNRPLQLNATKAEATPVDFSKVKTPELYFGNSYRRAQLGNAPLFLSDGQAFSASIPQGSLSGNTPYLEGEWIALQDSVKLASRQGAVELLFTAKNVNIVAGSINSTNLKIYIDGKRVEKQDYCPDAPLGTCKVDRERLYSIVTLPEYGTHRLRIEASGEGFELYTFTFG